MLFSELGLTPEVLRAVENAGYTTPTPIQEQAIPLVLEGRDILGCAQTGTGKTASFTLPMIEILAAGRARARMPRSLILEPTRELAAQVAENFELYGKYHKLNMALLIGGESFVDQIKKLDRGVDVLIATPGRMIDLFERGNILLSDIKVFVVDEADRMLDMGFIPDIERIVSLLPRIRQTLMFSATMPPEIRRLADSFLTNPREVSVAPPSSPAEAVTQTLTLVHGADKRKALRHLLKSHEVRNAFIFCNRKRDVSTLHHSLERHGFNAGALHGDLPQSKRVETLEAFRQGQISLLVCSDVAARGLDIADVSHVFNFDVPVNAEDYIHRIGRTGRAGRSGHAFTLATPGEGKAVAAIARLLKREIPLLPLEGFDSLSFGEEDAPRRGRERAAKGRERDGGSKGRTESRSESRGEGNRAETGRAEGENRSSPREESRREESRREEGRGGRSRPHFHSGRSSGELAAPPRREREGDRRRRDDEDREERGVIGFGDHPPAFMLRPARPKGYQFPTEALPEEET